jgi:integrase
MGLGSAAAVSLAKARSLAAKAREALAQGINPVVARDAERDAAIAMSTPAAPTPTEMTFGQVADQMLATLEESWRNAKHSAQWAMTLREYAAPLRSLSVSKVATEDVLQVLEPIWSTKSETASRLRGRIERVLSYAKARGLRTGENPALWRGHLDQILPPRKRLTRGHHAALAFTELPAFLVKLRAREATAARALEFGILTAARSGEILGAQWSEMALDRQIWTVPANRMKAGREHRVPLSARAVEIIEIMKLHQKGDFVFPSHRSTIGKDAPLSAMSLAMLLRRMEMPVTVHGFRSTFRDWSAECTSTANEVCEAALAHTIENRVEAAYRRGDLFEKRRVLMCAWADYCDSAYTTCDSQGSA